MDKEKHRERIIKILEKLKQRQRIDWLILFGSYARGDFGSSSDVDLIAISGKFKGIPKLRRSPPLYYEIHAELKLGADADIVCYTPEEFKRLKRESSFVREAASEGVEL